MNPLALVAFIGSFFVSLVGIICGHIALKQTKRDGTRGQGFALAGTIIGYVMLGVQVLTAIVLIVMLSVFGVTMGALFSAAESASRSAEGPDPFEAPDSDSRFGYAPENMLSGGAVFEEGFTVMPTPALAEFEDRVAPDVDRDALPLDVTVYVDYMCPACGSFEQTYGTMLEDFVDAGDITLQVYPLNFLDSMSMGGEYSTRAANLFGCLVEQQPETAFAAHGLLLSPDVQPAEGTEGLTADELLDVAEDAGAIVDEELEGCVREVPFDDFFDENTRVATSEGMLGLEGGPRPVSSTPTVVVNGVPWDQASDGDLEAHLLQVQSELQP
ncbi:thioredoxin domain-containing protein [Leucobacter sp. CSA1]|uniref:Thioredoxin domain-containing protein n=1 Tax=Leucobacter chromiisoli TaxID=2796471 RepID=A0A934UU30_9MICO|nr:thioredoxin domain-containing protein [Leucobacter chromiisoli]MBK0419059.1 thioredoxin domain-containing protein [Leucobacter chromiisoli]